MLNLTIPLLILLSTSVFASDLECPTGLVAPAAIDYEKLPDLRWQFFRKPTFFTNQDGQRLVRVAFFDADGTLRISKSGDLSPRSWSDVEMLPGAPELVAHFRDQGYLVAIVSNQGGIPKHLSLQQANGSFAHTMFMLSSALKESANHLFSAVHYLDFAEKYDDRRKPQVGMAMELRARLKAEFGEDVDIDWSQSLMVGDAAYTKDDVRPDGTPGTDFSNSDRLFAEKLGIRFIDPRVGDWYRVK